MRFWKNNRVDYRPARRIEQSHIWHRTCVPELRVLANRTMIVASLAGAFTWLLWHQTDLELNTRALAAIYHAYLSVQRKHPKNVDGFGKNLDIRLIEYRWPRIICRPFLSSSITQWSIFMARTGLFQAFRWAENGTRGEQRENNKRAGIDKKKQHVNYAMASIFSLSLYSTYSARWPAANQVFLLHITPT